VNVGLDDAELDAAALFDAAVPLKVQVLFVGDEVGVFKNGVAVFNKTKK
jgi:hypothetical protein